VAGRHPTQASLETKLAESWRRFERGDVTVAEAFGADDDWLLPLGSWHLRLDPILKRWYVYRRTDGWWADSGHGPGEALFVAVDRVLGEKLLPAGEPRDVSAWCLLRQGDELDGPLPRAEAAGRFAAGELPPGALVWTATATSWRPASEALGEAAPRSAGEALGEAAPPPRAAASAPAPEPLEAARPASPSSQPKARSPEARFCARCGAPFADDARFCMHCGLERR